MSYTHPALLSYEISFSFCECFENISTPLSKSDAERSDNTLVFMLNYKLMLFINFKSNTYCAFLDECYLAKLIQLIYEGVILRILARLQIPQQARHKLPVRIVIPRVICLGDVVVAQAEFGAIHNSKIYSKFFEELSKKEAAVQAVLDVARQLVQQIKVFLLMNGRILIILKPVIKILFDLFL